MSTRWPIASGTRDAWTGSTGCPSTATTSPAVAEINPEGRRRGAIDDPQAHACRLLDADDLGIGECPVVGEVSVIVDVVQVHGHGAMAHRHAVPGNRPSIAKATSSP
jgi:hypothetical protein